MFQRNLDETPPAPTTHERVLDAAERLLRAEKAEFSMRDLAAEAGVSFATPFNRFGSKAAITLALSERRIALMQERLLSSPRPGDAPSRVIAAVDIAVDVMLAEPAVNRAVMASLGAMKGAPGAVLTRSAALWSTALGDGEGFAAPTRALAVAVLPAQLAIAFRGVLSFWTAGEVDDQALPKRAHAATAALLLGFVAPNGKKRLLDLLA